MPFFLLIFAFFGIHLTYFRSLDTTPGLDATSYSHAVQSLRDFEIEKKFNNKLTFYGIRERIIERGDMPSYGKYLLAPYAFPTMRLAYAWTGFLFGGRLAITNFILILLGGILIYFVVYRLSGQAWTAFLAGLFFFLEPSNAYNAYVYQSHTTCGIFYFLVATSIYLLRGCHWSVFFALSLSVFSSTHTAFLAAFFSLFAIARERKLGALAGLLPIPLYVWGVEWWLEFDRLGIPSWWDQNRHYHLAGLYQMGFFPFAHRFLWDARLLNIFALPLVVLGIGSFKFFRRPSSAVTTVLLAAAVALPVSAAYGLPLSRTATPYAVLIALILGYHVAQLFASKSWVAIASGTAMLGLFSINFFHVLGIARLPQRTPAGYTLNAEERARSVKEILKGHPDGYLRLDPMDLVVGYTPTRHFETLTPERYRNEFRFFDEALRLAEKSPVEIVTVKRNYWDFSWWDNEYNYPVGYYNRVNHFLRGTALEGINTSYLYFFNARDLRRASESAEPLAAN